MPTNLENSTMKRWLFIPIPKKGNAKEYSNYHIAALISHASKVMFKILQAMLQQYVNWELPDVQAGFTKGRGTEIKLPAFIGSYKIWEFPPPKKKYFCFIHCTKAFDCVDNNKLWKIFQVMGIPDHLACLLRNLYVYQEEAVRNGHETTDWFQNGKGEAQGRIKISGRTINNLKYADDITLMAEIK